MKSSCNHKLSWLLGFLTLPSRKKLAGKPSLFRIHFASSSIQTSWESPKITTSTTASKTILYRRGNAQDEVVQSLHGVPRLGKEAAFEHLKISNGGPKSEKTEFGLTVIHCGWPLLWCWVPVLPPKKVSSTLCPCSMLQLVLVCGFEAIYCRLYSITTVSRTRLAAKISKWISK